MLKQSSIIGFILLTVVNIPNADDSDRIGQLENKIQELEARLAIIESLIKDTDDIKKPVKTIDGWKSVTNWRKLSKGMSPNEVKKILGEPHRVDGGNFTHWYYKNRGDVVFYEGSVYQWSEPRQ